MWKTLQHRTSLALTIATLTACGGSPAPEPSAPPTTPMPAPSTPTMPNATTTTAAAQTPTTATSTPTETATPTAPQGPTASVRYTGMSTPESVLYDEANDRYLVSNINGKPTEVDNNGYISVLSPDGKVTTEKWISGGQNKVTLNAPKGSAIAGGILYVADIDTVRMFDLKTGAPKGDVKIAGATFLNDVAAAPDGKVYVTDTGVKLGASGFEPTGTDAVYVIDKTNKAKALAKDKELGRPNGITVGPTGVWVVTMGTGELYRLDDKGKRQDVQKLPKGMLDGIVVVGDTLYVSSWEASAVYKGKPGGTFEVALPNLKSPADIGFDKKRSRLLVPLFTENAVEGYDIK